jgi:sugar-specific transcriptional regulator TrmB
MSTLTFDKTAYELTAYGLSLNQAKIYLALLRLGRGKASDVSRLSKVPRAEVYRVVDKLQKMGLIEATLERPVMFQPVRPDKLVEILLNNLTEKMAKLTEKRDKIISDLKPLEGKVEREERIYFCTIVGRRATLEKAIEMCNEAKEEILYMVSGLGLRQVAVYGLLEAFQQRVSAGVRVRVISEIQESNLRESKLFLNICELRHADQLTARIMLVDHTQAMVGVSIKEDLSLNVKEHIELWTNNPGFISIMDRFFQELWSNATGAKARIQSIETARPIEEFKIIRGRHETLGKIIEMTKSANSEIDHVTTVNGLHRIYQTHYEQYRKQSERGIKIQILAPVTTKNKEVAKKLVEVANLKNMTSTSTIRLCLVDDREMMLYEPFPDDPTIDAGLYVAFWNNSKAYIMLMKSVFQSLWGNASDVRFTA